MLKKWTASRDDNSPKITLKFTLDHLRRHQLKVLLWFSQCLEPFFRYFEKNKKWFCLKYKRDVSPVAGILKDLFIFHHLKC